MPPPPAPGYGYPPPAPGYGYPPAPPGYGYPPSYGYGQPGAWTQGWRPPALNNSGLAIAMLILGGIFVLLQVLTAVTSYSAVDAYDAAAARGDDPVFFTAYDAFGLLSLLAELPLWIVGSLWLMRARENAALIDPAGLRRSAVWAWLGWWVPVVAWWFPKQLVDDSWRITSRALPGGGSKRSRYRSTGLWWGLWVTFVVLTNLAGRQEFMSGFRAGATGAPDPHQGIAPGLQVLIALVCLAAYLAWIPVVRGLTRAQAELSGTATPPAV